MSTTNAVVNAAQRIQPWAGRSVIAGALLGAADAGFIAALVPAAASDPWGFALTVAQLVALYAFCLLPFGVVLAMLDRPAIVLRLPRADSLLASILLAIPAVAVFALVTPIAMRPDLEFRGEVISLVHAVQGCVVVLACICMARATQWLARSQQLSPSVARFAPAFLLALLAMVSLGLAHLASASIYNFNTAAVFTLAGGAALMLALRVTIPAPPPLHTRAAAAALVLVAALGLYVPGAARDHARFVVYVRGAASTALLPALRAVFDRDGDGAVPSWAGGMDCREGNPMVGPAIREVPGDGIDQDCRGGDSPPLPDPSPLTPGPPLCRPGPTHPNIILFVVDSMRGDFVSPEDTPSLWTLASGSQFFTHAYSPTSATQTSFPSLLAGRPLSDMGMANPVVDDTFSVDATIVERFKRAGYSTLHFGQLEFNNFSARGFDRHNPHWVDASVPNVKHDLTTVAYGRGLLEELAAAKTPLFVLMHMSDVHAPYVLGKEGDSEREAYRAGIRYFDLQLGQLLARMQADGSFASTVIALTSDHGEELFQRGRHGHGANVFQEGVHVPLVLWVPNCAPQKVDRPVVTSRLGPTLGAIAGVDVPGLGLFSQTDLPTVTEGANAATAHHQRAVVLGDYKLISDVVNGGRMLFHLRSDPGEENNICRREPERCAEVEAAYQRWLDRPGRR